MSRTFIRCMHLGRPLQKGRRQYFNKHLKVTDPKLQDPEHFERLAEALPLDNHYLDNLKNLWTQKVGCERDLMMKASDNLIGRDSGDYALSEIEPLRPRVQYADVDALRDAPEEVKKIFSVEFGQRSDWFAAWKKDMIDQVKLHDYDKSSLQSKIALTTVIIRHWTALVDELMSRNPKKPTKITHNIFLMLGYRRKLLRQLREQDFEAFTDILEKLKISYQLEKPPEYVKTRKAWSEHKLRQKVDAEKEKKLEELRVQFEEARETRIPALEAELQALSTQEAEIQKQLKELEKIEGKNVADVKGKYELQTVHELSEVVMHNQLLYFKKPSLN